MNSLQIKISLWLAITLLFLIIRCFRVNRFLIDSHRDVGDIALASGSIVLGLSLIVKGIMDPSVQKTLNEDTIAFILGGITQVTSSCRELKKDIVYAHTILLRHGKP